mgnify:CR=1 FL=1
MLINKQLLVDVIMLKIILFSAYYVINNIKKTI